MATNGSVEASGPEKPNLLYGVFYPQFDIPVIILWSFIIIAGLGNWALVGCFLRRKALRIPFNMIFLSLALTNGISTSIIGPMQLSRVFVLYNPVPVAWCKVRIAIRTFCFTVSLLVTFTLGALRLYAGISSKQLKLTFRKIAVMVVGIYGLAAVTTPLLLIERTKIFVNCMGQTDISVWDSYFPTNEKNTVNVGKSISDDNLSTTPMPVNETPTAMSEISNTTIGNLTEKSDALTKGLLNYWLCYLFFTFGFFCATVICYIALVIVLHKHHNAIKDVTLSNKKNILTMKVTVYVTVSFFISFLLPFFPAVAPQPPQGSIGNLHYIAMFHCLSTLDGALTPLIYYFLNPTFKAACNKAFIQMTRKISSLCCHKVTPFVDPQVPIPLQPNVPSIVYLKPGPYIPHLQQGVPSQA